MASSKLFHKWRGAVAVIGYTVALSAQYQTAQYPVAAMFIMVAGVAWNIWLFLPEIRAMKIAYPKGTPVSSPAWIYLFGIAAVGLVLFAGVNLYVSVRHSPTSLTSGEFAERYIHGKYIRIAELADANNVIEGRTLEDTWIYGPAVLFITTGTDIGYSHFNSSPNLVFLPVAATSVVAGRGTGIIVVRDSKFRRCHFVNITILGPEEMIEVWKKRNPLK